AITDMAGSWSITWVADPANVNPLKLTTAGERIEGTYVNDKRTTCKVTGSVDEGKGTISFVISGPAFEVKCDGLIESLNLVSGSYVAYGGLRGSFRMSRIQK